MALLFKNPDNTIRRIDTLDPNVNPNNDVNYTATQQPNINEIPLAFGHTLVSPVPIYKIKGEDVILPGDDDFTKTEMVFYAISANHHASEAAFNAGDFVGNVYLNGSEVTGLLTVSPTTNRQITTVDWRTGKNSSTNGALGAAIKSGGGTSSNFGGDQANTFSSNVYVGYVKAGSNFTEHAFYSAFDGSTPGFPTVLRGAYPDNQGFDMLVVYYKYNDRYFSSQQVDVQLEYNRWPRFKTGAGDNPDTRQSPTVGNCILEILDNSEWGLGLSDDDYVYDDFRGVGPTMGGVFSITDKPLFEILKIINSEQVDNQLSEQEGKLRYSPTNVTGFAITDDNIIGEIEVQYPDNTVAPTKMVATYNSYAYGSTEIEIGTDDTNVVSINISTANNLNSAKTLAQNIWDKLNNTVTITFTADKSMQQFSVYDSVALSTEVFSSDAMTIIQMTLNSDYTYSITAEADAGQTVPTANLRNKTPVIQIGNGFYRPPDQEPVPVPTEPSDGPVVQPPPAPPSNLLTIAGLNHPYNHTTGATNTDWYLGSTVDGTTAETQYDANGCRTRYITLPSGGAAYATDYSLIYRDQAGEQPTAIEVLTDIGIGASDQSNNPAGWAYWGSIPILFRYPNFFSSQPSSIQFNQGTGWKTLSKSWPAFYKEAVVYPDGSDPYVDSANPELQDYVYQVGDIPASNFRNLRLVHTFNEAALPSGNNRIKYIDPLMKRSNVYRLHFTAIFGDYRAPNKVEYIGSTTMWGDNRSVQDADQSEASRTAGIFGQTFTSNYTSPPDRDLT